MRKLLTGFVVLLAIVLVSTATLAADQTVLRVLVVETDDVEAYAQEIEKGRTLLTKLGAQVTIRLWQGTVAGENTGAVVVSIEYASLAAFADVSAKAEADAEFSAWVKGLDKIRTVVSDSLYREVGG